jgi:hypothetical protein
MADANASFLRIADPLTVLESLPPHGETWIMEYLALAASDGCRSHGGASRESRADKHYQQEPHFAFSSS